MRFGRHLLRASRRCLFLSLPDGSCAPRALHSPERFSERAIRRGWRAARMRLKLSRTIETTQVLHSDHRNSQTANEEKGRESCGMARQGWESQLQYGNLPKGRFSREKRAWSLYSGQKACGSCTTRAKWKCRPCAV